MVKCIKLIYVVNNVQNLSNLNNNYKEGENKGSNFNSAKFYSNVSNNYEGGEGCIYKCQSSNNQNLFTNQDMSSAF